ARRDHPQRPDRQPAQGLQGHREAGQSAVKTGLLVLTLAATSCIAEFPATSPNTLVDSGMGTGAPVDATADSDATLRPDARADSDAASDDAASDDAASDDAASDDASADLAVVEPADGGPTDMGCVPRDEICNSRDEDCDGIVDEDVPGDGEACERGVGACAQDGVTRCDPELGAFVCGAMPGEENAEVCNGVDDDCDDAIDEGLGLGDACMAGVGACQAAGTRVCAGGGALLCNAVVGTPDAEVCNAVDDDCDGAADEGFGLANACERGVGACLRVGAIACFDDVAGCDVEVGAPEDERCNDTDDDCDGMSDEGLGKGDDCTLGEGECLARGQRVCANDATVICDADVIAPTDEICNARDDDCDGVADEGLLLGEPCTVGIGECANNGENVCANDGVACSVVANPAANELCDGRDNDCDGAIDEGGTCADDAIAGCQVWLGWRDRHPHNGQRSLSPSGTWGNCPADPSDNSGDLRCNSTRNNANYQSFNLSGSVGEDDLMGIRFVCGPDQIPAWVQDHCEVFLAYGDVTTPAQIAQLDPAACASTFSPARFGSDAGCVRTGHDDDFHPIAFVGGVNGDDAWGVALRCDDPTLPDRAAGLQTSLLLHVALQDRENAIIGCRQGRISNTPAWRDDDDQACPLIGSDSAGRETCASSSGDGAFHGFKTNNGQLGGCWSMGVALKRVAPLGADANP
ncbi:MAG: hypothetical protein ACI9U2_004249, partial [Bradymonadia bacterium]